MLTSIGGQEYPFLVKGGTDSELIERNRGVERKQIIRKRAINKDPFDMFGFALPNVPFKSYVTQSNHFLEFFLISLFHLSTYVPKAH